MNILINGKYCSLEELFHREKYKNRYTKYMGEHTISTLCDVCENACGFCDWSEKGKMMPIPGWDAIRRDIVSCVVRPGGIREYTAHISYVVLHCPKFILEKKREPWFENWDPEKRRRALEREMRTEAVS